MKKIRMSEMEIAADIDRVIGRIDDRRPGPTIVAVGGIHGNETAGVEALERVFEAIEVIGGTFNGRFLGLRGNVAALERSVRFIDEDMNRIWFSSIIDKIRQTPKKELETNERREIKSLLDLMDEFLPRESTTPTIFADLHSFSAQGNMFAITAPKEQNISLFARLHVPLIFGIEKTLQGTALSYYQQQGYTTFAIEGGQHEDRITVQNNTAAMLAMLDEVGCLSKTKTTTPDRYESFLAEQNKRAPGRVELVYQHIIQPGDHFKMRPGFENFQHIQKGEWLASDRNGKIYAQCDGYMLMPLYQAQGNDGFFIAQSYGQSN